MAEPSPVLLATIRAIDGFSVIARHVFHAPTIWAYDVTYMLYGTLFMLGTAYALRRGAHIRTDMLWENYSDRTKGLVDAGAYIVFFFPGILFLLFASLDEAYYAWQIGEVSEQTAWRPIIYPFKAVVPLAALLLLIQGVSELLKSLYAAGTGTPVERTEAPVI
jgi:TRAP-type mannitol/chloroaromatic compound transport system permease small subunit